MKMPALRAEGIILRKYFLRETSYVLVVFTRGFGKIRGVLKGVRDPYPQFAGNFEIFTQCDLLFYKKKRNMDLVTHCEARDFFLTIRKDIERLTYASYFIELLDIATGDHDKKEELYLLLLESLRSLAAGAGPKRTARVFEIKLLEMIGLLPALDACLKCASPEPESNYFSVTGGGIICGNCVAKEDMAFRISKGTVNFIRKIASLPLSRTGQIKVAREVGMETEKALKMFMPYHIGRQVKSMKFLEEMERGGILTKD